MNELLSVEGLTVGIRAGQAVVRPVEEVSFTIQRGSTHAIVGESGCGKSLTALAMLQLLPEPAAFIERGRILFDGEDLLDRTCEQMRTVRGRRISMIFQEPMTSLNPVLTIGRQLMGCMTAHGVARVEAVRRAPELLDKVRLPDPRATLGMYPHQLSGGMRQRVLIAMAIANGPELLLADEPTTALDVSVEASILDLLRGLQAETGMSILWITHDLGLVPRLAHEVTVMYAGRVVEQGPVAAVFSGDGVRHPYTRALFTSLPDRRCRGADLRTLDGAVPDPSTRPPGCRLANRCPEVLPDCSLEEPDLRTTPGGVRVRCIRVDPCGPSTSDSAPHSPAV